MSDAALRVRAFLMTLSEEDRAWLADELAASLSEPHPRSSTGTGRPGGRLAEPGRTNPPPSLEKPDEPDDS